MKAPQFFMKLSVIIPSHNDIYLQKTIDSLLESSVLGDQLEVIAVLDGYWTKLKEDPRVKTVHLGKNQGMRNAINTGVKASKGEFIMRTDEHCIFARGYDKELTDSCKENWIMTPRRFFLDPVKWEVMDLPHVDYEKLAIQSAGEGRKFCGIPWKRDRKELIDETQAMQGSCWIMPRRWWDEVIKELETEVYGPLLQDSHEMTFKTWKAGGKLMVSKKTWFAHKHVSFDRTHSYSRNKAEKEVNRAYELWKDYYQELKEKWKTQFQ